MKKSSIIILLVAVLIVLAGGGYILIEKGDNPELAYYAVFYEEYEDYSKSYNLDETAYISVVLEENDFEGKAELIKMLEKFCKEHNFEFLQLDYYELKENGYKDKLDKENKNTFIVKINQRFSYYNHMILEAERGNMRSSGECNRYSLSKSGSDWVISNKQMIWIS